MSTLTETALRHHLFTFTQTLAFWLHHHSPLSITQPVVPLGLTDFKSPLGCSYQFIILVRATCVLDVLLSIFLPFLFYHLESFSFLLLPDSLYLFCGSFCPVCLILYPELLAEVENVPRILQYSCISYSLLSPLFLISLHSPSLWGVNLISTFFLLKLLYLFLFFLLSLHLLTISLLNLFCSCCQALIRAIPHTCTFRSGACLQMFAAWLRLCPPSPPTTTGQSLSVPRFISRSHQSIMAGTLIHPTPPTTTGQAVSISRLTSSRVHSTTGPARLCLSPCSSLTGITPSCLGL